MHLLGGLAKFEGVRSYIFDSNEGTRFMVEAMGGLYQSFDTLALNPLDAEDTPINRQRLALLVRLMLGEAGQVDGIEDVLAHVVETAFKLPVEARTFNSIYSLVFPPRTDARRVFSRWVKDDKGREGLYASTFNAARDSLGGLLDQGARLGCPRRRSAGADLRHRRYGRPADAQAHRRPEKAAGECGRTV